MGGCPTRPAAASCAHWAVDSNSLRYPSFSVTGPDRSPYALGHALWLWEGEVHVGTVHRVRVMSDGSHVSLERFNYNVSPAQVLITLRKLAVLEITAYLLTTFPRVTTLSYVFSHAVADLNGIALANARARFLNSMGAELVSTAPGAGGRIDGNFTIVATWRRTPETVRIVEHALAAARLDRSRDIREEAKWWSRLRRWGAKLMP